jgi:hypothetical protein
LSRNHLLSVHSIMEARIDCEESHRGTPGPAANSNAPSASAISAS